MSPEPLVASIVQPATQCLGGINAKERVVTPDQNKKTILYVEDNPECRQLFLHMMESVLPNQHVLLTLDNAEIALEKMEDFTFDFVFLDIQLPGMSGIEAVRIMQARDESLDTVYVAISAAIDDRYIRAVLDAGFDYFLAKPIQLSQLANIIEYY